MRNGVIANDANDVELAAYGGYVYGTFAANRNGGVYFTRDSGEVCRLVR